MRRLLTILILVLSLKTISAQELNCQVQVLSQQIAGTDKRTFDALQTAIYEFMNTRKWTNENFKIEERIDCSILINLTEKLSADEFKGTLQIQSRRPVYKTSYYSTLLNYNDNDIIFKYIENQPIEFQENTYSSNLASILAFYAYYMIGLDYDSFAPSGGTAYLQKALGVVNNAQNAGYIGWKAFDGNQNRYWMINNILDATFVPIRDAMYEYHRKGLDVMYDQKDAGRAVILEALKNLKKVHQVKPLSFSMQVFFIAKSEEIINIFCGGFSDEKAQVTTLLNEIDPTNSNKYTKIANCN